MPASHLAKASLWKIENRHYSLLEQELWELGNQLPEYYGPGRTSPRGLSQETRNQMIQSAWERFRNMDLFFVKVSADLRGEMSTVACC